MDTSYPWHGGDRVYTKIYPTSCIMDLYHPMLVKGSLRWIIKWYICQGINTWMDNKPFPFLVLGAAFFSTDR